MYFFLVGIGEYFRLLSDANSGDFPARQQFRTDSPLDSPVEKWQK
jgi:hypothetical protein